MSDKREWTAERHAAAWGRCNRATSGPWKWWTSNSHRRLTAEGRQDGGVAYGTKHKDGCGDIVIGEHDMAFIEEARLDLPDALREIERLKCDLSDVATALNGRLAEATAEIERLRDTVHNYKALLAAAEAAGREVCDERDAAASALDVEIGRGDKATGHVYSLAERINFVIGGLRDEARRGDEAEDKADRQAREIERLKADLLLLGALKSEEVAPVIERFREAFGADVPQAPGLTDDRLDLLLSEAAAIGGMQGPPEMKRAALRGSLLMVCSRPAKADPPVRHARHDRHCLIHDGVRCSHEPGCEVER